MYTALDHSRRTSVYVRFALRYQTTVQAGKVPDRADLRKVAAARNDRYAPYVKDGAASLEEILETVWDYREPSPQTTASNFRVFGCMALAALLDDPSDLEEIEGPLRNWLAKHHEAFTKLFH